MSRLVNMVPPVDLRKVVGSTVYAKSIHVMTEAERNILYGSQAKVKMVVINVYLKILSKGVSNSMLLLTKKTLMEVSRGPGYILSVWLQDQF